MPPQTLRNQRDRFIIWAKNLGALQEGRASLDFRLQESILMKSAVYKLLKQLHDVITKSIEVVRGSRKPLEESLALVDEEGDLWGSSDDESSLDEQDGINMRTELGQNTVAIMQILSDLFKLSFKIRNPATRSSGQSVVKPLLFKQMIQIDDTTSVDLLACFAAFDRGHTQEAIREMRFAVHGKPKLKDAQLAQGSLAHNDADETNSPPAPPNGLFMKPREEQQDFLVDRWSKSLTNRRRYFAYWKTHALKLAREDEEKAPSKANSEIQDSANAPVPIPTALVAAVTAPSLAGKSLLSVTEVSTYDRKLDDEIDAHSVVSYASTTYDMDGTIADLPSAPQVKPPQTEFQCPYCCVTCPARHAKGKAWREHILRDIQPYMCTYEECSDADALYASRSAWLAHEANAHRRSEDSLLQHLEAEHGALLGPAQIHEVAKLSYTTTVDQRSVCPFCQSAGPFIKGLANHMAYHMEQLACFAVPRGSSVDDDMSSLGSNTDKAQGRMAAASLTSALQVSSKASSRIENDYIWEDKGMHIWNAATVERLLDRGTDVDLKDRHSRTPLSWAAENGNLETSKEPRSMIVHELAVQDQPYNYLESLWDGKEEDFKYSLLKVAQFDPDTQMWALRKHHWRELDVWTYDYGTQDSRQKAIDNAIRQFEKMRLSPTEPDWEKLLPKEERGKGKIVSKLQANIAKASSTEPPPKIKISDPTMKQD
ncbi:hypothetical protein LZ32DRAFT_525673 [Colletotrichum eremochloae]|nr:hypothetical protein LZ32DRAFT_525673 [Colletotrichum eremochloae]